LAEGQALFNEATSEGRTEFGFGFGNVLIKVVAVSTEVKDQKFGFIFSEGATFS
jgi:hypothetical protein